jgi:pimeloyl-ACP methyl ester carboxylesterase
MALARTLQVFALFEFVLYGILYVATRPADEWTLFGYLGFAFSVYLVLRAVTVGASFGLAWLHRSTVPEQMRLDPIQAVALVLREFWITLLCYCLLQPWVGRFGRPDPANASPGDGTPVILVHGFFCNAAYWWGLRRRLAAAGIGQVYTLSLEPIYNDIDRFGRQLADRVGQVLAETGAEQVMVVGHSMGGLVARVAALRHGLGPSIAGIVTLGTPHYGTALAAYSAGQNVRQMADHSPWLTDLARAEDGQPSVPLTSIFSYHDNIVAPQENSILARATNHAVAGVGHLALAYDGDVQKRVIDCIVRLRSNAAGIGDASD